MSRARSPAARYALENNIPYLGLCLGMQIATIEFARNVLKLEKAHSTEFDPDTPHPVIALLDEQKNVTAKGGTMRLGRQACQLVVGSKAAHLYGAFVVNERHRHRYEVNNAYRDRFAKADFALSGTWPDGKLVEPLRAGEPSVFPCEPVPSGISQQTAQAPSVVPRFRHCTKASPSVIGWIMPAWIMTATADGKSVWDIGNEVASVRQRCHIW